MADLCKELTELKAKFDVSLPDAKLVAFACTDASRFVRVDMPRSRPARQISVWLHFSEDYPSSACIVELHSNILDKKFLDGLTINLQQYANEHVKQLHAAHVLQHAQEFIARHPLYVCINEIQAIREIIGNDGKLLKLKQSACVVELNAKAGPYFYHVQAWVPTAEYPKRAIQLQDVKSNLPAVLRRYISGQSLEIARQCVEPPAHFKGNFKPTPSLQAAFSFCLKMTRTYHDELCSICGAKVLAANPTDASQSIERSFCGHLFHQACLKTYLERPPFPKGGKSCLAKVDGRDELCNIRIAINGWLNDSKVLEARWSHKKAHERELEDIREFFF